MKIGRKILAAVLAVCIAAFCMPAAFAESASKTTLRVGYFDYTGFVDKNSNGGYSGYAVDYLNKISLYTDYNYKYIYGDWDKLLRMLASGGIDILCSAQYTPERAELFDYTDAPIGYESAMLYVRSDDDRYYYDDFASFNGMRVGQLENSYQNEVFAAYAAQHGFSYTPVDYKETADAFKALSAGELDAVAMGNLAVQTGYKTVGHFSSDPFYIITRKGNDEVLKNINYALSEINVVEPYYEAELYNKYYETAYYNTKPAFTRSEAEYIESIGKIKVGVMSGRFPLVDLDSNGALCGIQIDTMNLISQLSGINFEYDIMQSGINSEEYLTTTDAKMVAGLMSSSISSFGASIRLSDSFMTDDMCFVGREGELLDADASFTFALPAGCVSDKQLLASEYPNANFLTCTTNDECLYAILNGKADYMLQDYYIISARLQSPRFDGLSIMNAYSFPQNACIGILDTESPELMSIINKCIARLNNRDLISSIAAYTTGSPYQMTLGDFVYKYRIAVVVSGTLLLAVMALLVLMIAMRRRNELILKAKNEQLNVAIMTAENANKAKGTFLSNMSHDIRTPMNVIINMTQLALDESDDAAQVKYYLGKIKFMGRYLLGLINNILDVSKIESGKMELHCEPYTFHMFLDSLYTMIEPMCIEDKIKFVTECDENYPTIIVDATRFNQIFYNFLSNAVKYTPAGGTVKFKMENVVKTDDTLEWDSIISDTGIGMSEEFQKEMFDPFAQEETKQRGAVPKMNGTGLGLAIAKSFTELMGGHIKVDSKLGEGTKITVHMCCPLADEENMPEEKTETTPCDIDGMSLLLAEDHPLNAEIARRLLEKKGARVMWCENGRLAAEAFEKSRINEFDAVLMDIRMPIMDGYTATKAIRALARPDAKTVPIIAMTANAYESDRQASITAGMNAHISKPISPQILYDTLSSFYKNKKDS